MNELLFIFHSLLTLFFVLIAHRFGKEWLISTTVIQWIFANLFVLKQIELFGLNATASDAFAVGGTLGIALIQEFYGEKLAKKTVAIGFYSLAVFAIVSWVHGSYLPSVYDSAHPHYDSILVSMPRIVFASFAAYLASQFFNIFAASFLKKLMHDRAVLFRTLTVVTLTQFLDTALFASIGLSGIVQALGSVILVGFLIKCISLVIATPLLSIITSRKKDAPISL